MESQETLRPKFYIGQNIAKEHPDYSYAIGFYTGQMEKVITGACRFCMFRPDEKDRESLENIIRLLADSLGLETKQHRDEFWISHKDYQKEFEVMCNFKVNSPEYHRQRAIMCGVDEYNIDEEYHLRSGHEKHTISQC